MDGGGGVNAVIGDVINDCIATQIYLSPLPPRVI